MSGALPVEPVAFGRAWLLSLPGVRDVVGDEVGPDLIGEGEQVRLSSLGALPPGDSAGESRPRLGIECWDPADGTADASWRVCAAIVAGTPGGAPWTREDGAHVSDAYVSTEPYEDRDRETGRHRWLLAVTMTLHPAAP